MARIRTIKPDFWTDEKIVELSPLARLLFIGLWNFADDEGRMPYSPTKIKLQILPADSAQILELLGEIRGKSLIEVYVVDGKEYLQVVSFTEHQKIDKRTPSKYPANTKTPPNSPELPGIPTTEVEGKGKEVTTSSVPDESEAFKAFWQIWPKSQRKVAKGECWKLWRKNKFDSVAEQILSNVEAMKKTEQWRTGFDPMPEVYLRNRRWEGAELPPVKTQSGAAW